MPTPDSARAPYLAFATSRLLLVVTAYAVLTQFPVHTIEPWMTQIFPENNWIDGWVRWDAFWYEAIVDRAARFVPQGHSSANFFPFYAWASWVVALPFQPFLEYDKAFYLGGIVLSHTAFLLGLIGVVRVTEEIAGPDVAERTVWLMAFFPFSFFNAAVYADALYFCLSVWAFRSVHAERWTLASALAVMATLTRITGSVLMAALVVEFVRRTKPNLESIRRQAAAVAILAMAPVIVFTYFYLRYGDPIAFLNARQEAWHRATGIASLLTDIDYYTEGSLLSCGGIRDCLRGWDFTRQILGIWYFALVPLGVGLAIAARRTIGAGMVLWVVGTYAMALVNGLDGMGRFTSVLFPVFIALAMFIVRTRVAVAVVSAACVPFLLLFLGGFVRWRAVQ
ncbi:MAG: hypothetical protein ACRD2N_16335 [Vicinamibacterales bacterium]